LLFYLLLLLLLLYTFLFHDLKAGPATDPRLRIRGPGACLRSTDDWTLGLFFGLFKGLF
jgi:hypothetical protein